MTAPKPRGEMLTAGATLELITTLTAAEIDELSAAAVADGSGSITLSGVRWQLFGQMHLVDGIVLIAADGPVYLGHLTDYEEHRAEITIDLI